MFVEPFTTAARDSEKYIFPDLKKVSVTINSSPYMVFNSSIESNDMRGKVHHRFVKEKNKSSTPTTSSAF